MSAARECQAVNGKRAQTDPIARIAGVAFGEKGGRCGEICRLYRESFTQIDLANAAMLDNLLRGAFHQHRTIMDDIGAVNDI